MNRYFKSGLVLASIGLLSSCGGAGGPETAFWPTKVIFFKIITGSEVVSDFTLTPYTSRVLSLTEIATYREAIAAWNALGIVTLVERNDIPNWNYPGILIYGVNEVRGIERGEAGVHTENRVIDRVSCSILPPDQDVRVNRIAAYHEIGHSIGLNHTFNNKSVMFPARIFYVPIIAISESDKKDVAQLYP